MSTTTDKHQATHYRKPAIDSDGITVILFILIMSLYSGISSLIATISTLL